MDNYNKVKVCLHDSDCKLLTTFDEFEIIRENTLNKYYGFVRIKFIGICGHESSAVFTNFNVRKTGIKCKSCVSTHTGNTLQINNRITNNNITENDSIKIIEKYLTNYDIKRTNEGCTADLIIREKNNNSNWIPIQLKSTAQLCHNMYSFRGMKESYKDMLLICVCISEEKIWIMPYNDINIKKGNLNISKKSKYNKYFIEDNKNICNIISNYETNIVRNTYELLMKPVTLLQQREQEYVKKRESTLDFLKFDKMEIQNTPTDFIINGKKIQEKVAGKLKDTESMLIEFASNNGKVKGIRKQRTYRLNENDFYWINSSTDERFWVIPEIELFNRGYISNSEETKNKTRIVLPITNISTSNYNWFSEFEYNYNAPDKNKLIKLFE